VLPLGWWLRLTGRSPATQSSATGGLGSSTSREVLKSTLSKSEELAERVITISLAKARPTPRYRRTDRIINLVKETVARHMKVKVGEVQISQKLNEELWSKGKRSRLPRITVKVSKDEEGTVFTKLPNEKEEGEEEEQKAKEKEAKAEPRPEPTGEETSKQNETAQAPAEASAEK